MPALPAKSRAAALARRRRGRGRRRSLQELVVPGHVALVAVAHVAGALYAVELVGVDDELRVYAEASERLVHLLAALDGHVEVALAAEEERRRLDAVGVEERVGDFLVGLPGLRVPRRADLVVVLDDVLVGSVAGDGEGRARAARRGLGAWAGG